MEKFESAKEKMGDGMGNAALTRAEDIGDGTRWKACADQFTRILVIDCASSKQMDISLCTR